VAVVLQTKYTHEAQKMHAMLSKQEDDDHKYHDDHKFAHDAGGGGAGAVDGAGAADGAGAGVNDTEDLFFMRQFTSTTAALVAVVHSLANNLDKAPLQTLCLPNSPLDRWLKEIATKSPSERGYLLADANGLRDCCEDLASSSATFEPYTEDTEELTAKRGSTVMANGLERGASGTKPRGLERMASKFFNAAAGVSVDALQEEMDAAKELDLHEKSQFEGADFSCFLPAKNNQGITTLYELDGVKSAPVDLGPMVEGHSHGGHEADLLNAVAEEVRERALAFSVSEIEHCTPPQQILLALVKIGAPKVFC
jgi:hypothetical protein